MTEMDNILLEKIRIIQSFYTNQQRLEFWHALNYDFCIECGEYIGDDKLNHGCKRMMRSDDGQVFPVADAFAIIRAINKKKGAYLSALEWIEKQ